MSLAMIGYGSKFYIGSGASPVVYTQVAEVTDITPPSSTINVIDVTHMASPNRTKEFITGLSDPGTASFTINFVPGSAGDLAIQALVAVTTARSLRIQFPNLVTWTFMGLLTDYKPTVPTDGKMSAQVSFKVTGSYVTGTGT